MVLLNPNDPFNDESDSFKYDPRIEAKKELLGITLGASERYDTLLLEYATGSGKSNNAIQIHATKHPKGKVLIVVAEILHYNVWRDEYIKFGHEDLLGNVTMCCYQSLHKYIDEEWDLICCDECHRLLNSELRIDYLPKMKADTKLFLSATLTKDQKMTLRTFFPEIRMLKYSLKDALREGAINEYRIVFLEAKPDPTEVFKIYKNKSKLKKGQEYEVLSFKDRYKKTKNACVIECNALQYIKYHSDKAASLKSRMMYSERFKMAFLKARLDLKNVLADIKIYDAGRVLKKLEDDGERFICFTSSIEKADNFHKDHSIHSKKNSKLNSQIFDSFQDKSINSLYVVGKLTEGMNPTDVNVGVITQLDNTIRIYNQKVGRILRGDNPTIYILYLRDTLDEHYIKNVTIDLDEDLMIFSTVEDFLNSEK